MPHPREIIHHTWSSFPHQPQIVAQEECQSGKIAQPRNHQVGNGQYSVAASDPGVCRQYQYFGAPKGIGIVSIGDCHIDNGPFWNLLLNGAIEFLNGGLPPWPLPHHPMLCFVQRQRRRITATVHGFEVIIHRRDISIQMIGVSRPGDGRILKTVDETFKRQA